MEWKIPIITETKFMQLLGRDRKGNVISGIYEEKSHRIVSVDDCMIEDKKSQEIIRTIRGMLKSFKIKTYDEDTGYGLLRPCACAERLFHRRDHGGISYGFSNISI